MRPMNLCCFRTEPLNVFSLIINISQQINSETQLHQLRPRKYFLVAYYKIHLPHFT